MAIVCTVYLALSNIVADIFTFFFVGFLWAKETKHTTSCDMQDVTDDSRRLENEVFQVYKHLLKATVI